jgi:hypothetical protein
MERYEYFVGPTEFILDLIEEEEDVHTIPKEFLQITLIDNIIGDFLKQYNIDDLLKDVEKFNSPIVIPYKFNEKTYEATIYNYRYGYPDTRNQLTIRLSHDGFRYGRIDPKFIIEKKKNRKSPGWLVLSDDYLKDMNHLKKLTSKLNCKIQFMYHPFLKRIDILFVNSDGSNKLKLCFEHGYGKYDGKEEYYTDLK